MRIITGDAKPTGEWASLNEPCGKGDGTRTVFETPFPASEARGLSVARGYIIITPQNKLRVLDTDGKLLREEDDGYKVSTTTPEAPAQITFEKPVPPGVAVTVSALGRRPEKGEALRVLPMTDNLAKQIDEKMPPELRRRKRDDVLSLPAVQDWNREAYNRLVVDCHGFTDDSGEQLAFSEPVKKSILNTLGALMLGTFAFDRASVLMEEQKSGRKAELTD